MVQRSAAESVTPIACILIALLHKWSPGVVLFTIHSPSRSMGGCGILLVPFSGMISLLCRAHKCAIVLLLMHIGFSRLANIVFTIGEQVKDNSSMIPVVCQLESNRDHFLHDVLSTFFPHPANCKDEAVHCALSEVMLIS